MKTFSTLAALAISFVIVTAAHAQSGMAIENWKDIKVGPMFTAGAAVNAGPVATDSKTNPGFAFSGGALAIFPLSANIAFDLGLCYDARAINFRSNANSSDGIDYSVNYISLRPGFNLGGFTIGLGIGLPVGVSLTGQPGNIALTTGAPTSSDMNFLLEGRIGGSIPVIQSDKGALLILIEGSYGFSEIIKSSFYDGGDATKNNGPLASLELGVAYLFDLSPH